MNSDGIDKNNVPNPDPRQAVALAMMIEQAKKLVPKDLGVTILIFDYGEGGRLSYASSAMREDMLNTMKEFIKKHDNSEVFQSHQP